MKNIVFTLFVSLITFGALQAQFTITTANRYSMF